jgi:hypothetical protein
MKVVDDMPCGECHLQPGEVCDICGRRSREPVKVVVDDVVQT